MADLILLNGWIELPFDLPEGYCEIFSSASEQKSSDIRCLEFIRKDLIRLERRMVMSRIDELVDIYNDPNRDLTANEHLELLGLFMKQWQVLPPLGTFGSFKYEYSINGDTYFDTYDKVQLIQGHDDSVEIRVLAVQGRSEKVIRVPRHLITWE